MTIEEEPRTMNKLEWSVILSLFASMASIVFWTGTLWTKVNQNYADIVLLKAAALGNADRLARIETKLDLILEDRAAAAKTAAK